MAWTTIVEKKFVTQQFWAGYSKLPKQAALGDESACCVAVVSYDFNLSEMKESITDATTWALAKYEEWKEINKKRFPNSASRLD